MTTTILSSKRRFINLLLQLLRRNIATACYLFAIMFIFFPLQMFFETQRQIDRFELDGYVSWSSVTTTSNMYTSVSAVCMVGILLLAALIIGLQQCSYLHSKRAVDLYHSLPVSRTQLMLAGLCSSFATIAVPYIINYGLNAIINVYRISRVPNIGTAQFSTPQVIVWGEAFWDIFGWLVTILGILAVVNLVATQVGSIFENFVFSGELLFAPIAFVLLNQVIFESFLLGYVNNVELHVMASLTPATFMVGRMSDGGNLVFYNWVTLLWLLLSIAIIGVTLLLYRHRRSEIAETSGCNGALGVVLSAVVVYIAAPVVGMVIFSSLGRAEHYIYVVGVLVGSVLSYLLVEAVLNRGFAGMRRHLPRGAAVCALVTAFAVIVTTGGLGYETRLPNVDSVNSATLNSRGWYGSAQEIAPLGDSLNVEYLRDVTLTDKQSITDLIALHQQLIELNRDESNQDDSWDNYGLAYSMGGGSMKRYYPRANSQTYALLNKLEDSEAYQRAANPVLRVNPAIVEKVSLHDNLGFKSSELTTSNEIELLLEALGKDSLAAGTAPYIGGEEVVCYLAFRTPRVESRHYTESELKKIGLQSIEPQHFNSFSVPVFASYNETLRVLGSNLPAPAKLEEVTELGLGSYYYSYIGSNRGQRFVSQVSEVEHFVKSDIDSFTKETDKIEYAAQNKITTAINRSLNGVAPLYATFFKGREQGITVMLTVDQLPSDFFDDSPSLMQRYQAARDEAVAEQVEYVEYFS